MNEHVHPTLRSALAGIYNTIQETIGSPLRMEEPEQKKNETIKEMISDFEDKELFVTIDRLSGCCGAVVYPDSDICSDCKEHCTIKETCSECGGTGKIDVLDNSKSMEMRIDPPIKTVTCEKCNGEGYIEE